MLQSKEKRAKVRAVAASGHLQVFESPETVAAEGLEPIAVHSAAEISVAPAAPAADLKKLTA
jgi:hypothetical protein